MDNTDDGLIIIGDTLEELDQDNLPRKKPLTVEDQYALDAQGRRRFHGAFTGGFSAGYFNSVDTKDGWKPNQFKSSRSKKAKNVCQRPEDFMDEEDTGEFGIASTGIRASNDFANCSTRGTKRERAGNDNSGPIPGTPVLKDLLEGVRDTVGVRLLKRMGWKVGQGIGPRLTKVEKDKFRIKRMNKKIYGCFSHNKEVKSLGYESEVTIGDLEIDEGISFAPDDIDPFQSKPKDDYFGIGYRGLNKMSRHADEMKPVDGQIFRMQDSNKKLSIRGQAFGVGVFEADDDDIYEPDDMNRYDFALHPEQRSNNRWSDGGDCEPRPYDCLQGFVLADRQFERKKLSGPPYISGSFNPIHVVKLSRFSAAINKEDISNRRTWTSGYVSDKNDRRMNSQISAVAVEPQSVETCLSAENRNVALSSSWMDKLTVNSFVRSNDEATSEITRLSSSRHKESKSIDSADSAHGFGTDIGDSSDGLSKHFEPSTQSPKNEGVELERFRFVFRGASRECEAEVSSSNPDSVKQATILPGADTKTYFRNTIHTQFSEASAITAAKVKMFGKMTRTIDAWFPVSAVCKGFNIATLQVSYAQPDRGKIKNHQLFECVNFCSGISSNPTDFQDNFDTRSTNSQGNITYMSHNLKLSSGHDPIGSCDALKMVSTNFVIDDSISETGGGQQSGDVFESNPTITKICNDDKTDGKLSKCGSSVIQQNVTAETKHDLFKEIFLSCSESSESDDESTDDIHRITVESLLIGKPADELNKQRNTSPARGIFSQLNVEQVIGPTSNECETQNPSYLHTNTSGIKPRTAENFHCGKAVCDTACSSDVYGPALPAKFQDTFVQSRLDSELHKELILENDIIPECKAPKVISIWVEKSKAKKSKKTKKKQKQKSRGKNRKHKHKSGQRTAH